MKEKIKHAIDQSMHYLHGKEQYTTDWETFVACPNTEFLAALKMQLGGSIERVEIVNNNFLRLDNKNGPPLNTIEGFKRRDPSQCPLCGNDSHYYCSNCGYKIPLK